MSITVLLEPKAGGFRASINNPFPISVEGPTEEIALREIQVAYDARLRNGTRVVHLPVTNVERILETARAVGEDPLFEEYLKVLEENRRISNAIPESPV